MKRLSWVLTGCAVVIAGCGSDSFNDVAPANLDGSADQNTSDGGADGASEAASCPTGLGDCDGDPKNGCEADLLGSAEHCGSCSNACKTGSHATAACDKGTCKAACEAGWLDCDADPANGCEADPKTDAANCGKCGTSCPGATHAKGECAASTCGVKCDTGWDDCDKNDKNGCETDTTSTLSDCGTCKNACTSGDNTTSACKASTCAWTCNTGFGDCDNDAANGCEVDTTQSVDHCGACGTPCGTTHGTPSCTAGQCAIACEATFQDCDGNNATGCESSAMTDGLNCGWCGHDCKGAPCAGGVCAPTKVADYAYLVTAMAELDANLYFTADSPTKSMVLSVSKSSGTPATLVDASGNAAALAVDASGLYWVGSTGVIHWATLAGGTPSTLVTGDTNGKNLLLDGADMFWSAGTTATIYRAPKAGGTALSVGMPMAGGISGLVVDDANAFWSVTAMNSIQKVAKGGGTPSLFVSGQDYPRSTVLDSTNLYWTNYLQNTVVSMPKAGGAVTTVCTSSGHVSSLRIDGANLYWASSDGGIFRVAKSGGTPLMLATGQTSTQFVLVDATDVYWVNNVDVNNVTVWRVAK